MNDYSMRRPFFVLLLVAFAALGLNAQNNYYKSAKDSDPEAVKLLSDVRTKYDDTHRSSVDFCTSPSSNIVT